MKRILVFLFLSCIFLTGTFSQDSVVKRIRFQGLVMDANTFTPISDSHILVNKYFSAISDKNGSFAFYVNPNDTIIFQSLGYKPTTMLISDTLIGREYIAGIYMRSDTISIGTVIIVPRSSNLKSEILNAKSKVPERMNNARYNISLGAYQGRTSAGKLGDPYNNYNLIRQKQKVDAFERGGIPSDRIAGLNPLFLIPGAYRLMHGLPEEPPAFKPDLSDYELEQLNKKFLETLNQKK
jgi:hypothetical protein